MQLFNKEDLKRIDLSFKNLEDLGYDVTVHYFNQSDCQISFIDPDKNELVTGNYSKVNNEIEFNFSTSDLV